MSVATPQLEISKVAAELKSKLSSGTLLRENIGGALRMNAGAMGSSMFQVLESVRFMDRSGQVQEKLATEIPVEYRNCPLFRDHIALSAILLGKTASRALIDEKMNECSQK